MDSYKIFKQADDLVRQCGIRKPKLIVKELGIDLYNGEDLGDLLGMYTFRWNHRLMFINSKVSGRLKDMVIAHELGHDQQHRSIAKAGKALQEFSLFSMKDNTEYEANAFYLLSLGYGLTPGNSLAETIAATNIITTPTKIGLSRNR